MGKQGEKKKKKEGGEESKVGDSSPSAFDGDTAVFIAMAQELKGEGNKLFQKRDQQGAILKYEKALKLLPVDHIDVSYLRSNMAACYMQMDLSEYPRAIHECNLALEITPKYSKALLKRARCYEALNRIDLALKDVTTVLSMEPNNVMALEIADRVKREIERRGLRVNNSVIELPADYVESPRASMPPKAVKEKTRKKKKRNILEKKIVECIEEEKKVVDIIEEKKEEDKTWEKKAEEKVVVEENISSVKEDEPKKTVTWEKPEEKVVVEENISSVKEDEPKKTVTWEKPEEKVVVEENISSVKEDEPKKTVTWEKPEEKVVVEENISSVKEDEPKKIVKFVFGEDIRRAQLPLNCSLLQLREIIHERFPTLKAILIKYKDQEGDLITITTDEELGWAEAAAELQGSVRLYIVEVKPQHNPFLERVNKEDALELDEKGNSVTEDENTGKGKETKTTSCYIEDWIILFAQVFKNHVGFDSDAYMNIQELGMKIYSEAMEDAVTSEEAQDLFSIAAEKFQELAALALFNWGNVHMSRARKKVYFKEDASRESILAQIKNTYNWALQEYIIGGNIYEEALKVKPDFYEGHLALGQQKFEQAKLSWYYAISSNDDPEASTSSEVLQIYNNAEENMERGMLMWEELEEQRLRELSTLKMVDIQLQNMGLNGYFKDVSANEAAAQASNMRSQINLLWGTMLYERSMVEFKLGLPVWQECLEVALEKFKLAGASPTDIAVMTKNHCSNSNGLEGLAFKIDEIIQAWNDMYEAKRWYGAVPSFRLESLLRRKVSKLYHALEHAGR